MTVGGTNSSRNHVLGLRNLLGSAQADIAQGDRADALARDEERGTERPIDAMIAQSAYLSSIAKSLLIIAGRVVDEATTDAGMSKLPSVLAVKEDRDGPD
jgi:hypothetical protein